jgi:hypothetical protein
VVKANQERYMDAAWEQVGDVLAANQALNVARAVDLVARRVLERHLQPLDAVDLLSLTAPMHTRTKWHDQVLSNAIEDSTLPRGVDEPAFRRQSAPQNRSLKRAVRLSTAATPPDGSVRPHVVRRLAEGEFAAAFDGPVDGLTTSTLLDRLPVSGDGQVSGDIIGWPGSTSAVRVRAVASARDELRVNPPGTVEVRADIAITGVFLDRHLERLTSSAAEGPSLSGRVREVLAGHRAHPRAAGFVVPADRGSVRVIEGDRGRMVEIEPGHRLPDVSEPREGTTEVGTIRVAPPVADRRVVTGFVDAYTAFERAARPHVVSVIPEPAPLDLDELRADLLEAVNPHRTIVARAGTRIVVGAERLGTRVAHDRFRHEEDLGPVMVGPVLAEPLYRDLAAYDPDRLLPGAGSIPANAITLLETNPRFVEAFLVGANQEMNRELLWRRFPTDRRGTPFPAFWDRLDGQSDVGPIHQFAADRQLGANTAGSLAGNIVLLVRGDLLRRYPDSIIYAVPSRPDRKLDDRPVAIELPVFAGKLDPDITFVGFNLPIEEIAPAPGWFFVIQEQPTEPRFGLDESDGPPVALTTWSALNWTHVGVPAGRYLRLSALAPAPNLRLGGPASPLATWGAQAASMAAITFQRPFRVAIHASEVLAIRS